MARHSTDRDRTRRDKHHLAEPATPGSRQPLHYGRKFAETEAHLHARSHEHETSPSEAPADDHLGSTDAQVSPTPAHASSGATASETGHGPGSPVPARGPRTELPPAGGLAMVVAFGTDTVEAFRRLGEASWTVLLLPVRGARLLLRLGTSWIRGSPGRA